MTNLGKKLMVAAVSGILAAAMTMGAMAAEEKLAITVTGGGEDSMVLNTATVGTLNGLSACRHLYEGLYKLDAEGEPTLGQAASVDISDDMMTWTFTLRDDITWSDGQAVTADDFIFGF
ncbi:MAG: peptide ABC transporter substrate-binding protein, partial [Lachnospiraceae bacterium]|nr:peptide ABC transporter substrate-binding protein [Lachnospiraceae bacterium]